MSKLQPDLLHRLERRGMSRRDFLKFCGVISTTLALPTSYIPRVASALAASARLPVIWLSFQGCTGDTESFLRASDPSVGTILLELLSVNYHETLMVAAGHQAEQVRQETMMRYPGQYLAIVEGAIPATEHYCVIGGRSALDIVREVCGSALATITVGSCSWDGGLPAAAPNPTGALGVRTAVPGLRNLVSLPGCPMNVANLTAVISHYLTFNALPDTDALGRPYFAYGEDIHDDCERHDHYEEHRFVRAWGDQGHQQGWCLLKMGCRGPRTHSNCAVIGWNDGTSWPVRAGHGCIGCTSPHFWDAMTPFYAPGQGDDGDDHDD